MHLISLVTAATITLSVATSSVNAQDNASGAPTADTGGTGSTYAVDGQALFSPDPLVPVLKPYTDFQAKLDDELGLFIQGAYILTFQGASDKIAGTPTVTVGRHEFVAKWTVFMDDSLGTGQFGSLLEGSRVLDHPGQPDLSDNAGSSYTLNDNDLGYDIALVELWYAQGFIKDQVTFVLGKIDQTVYFDINNVADDETTQFLADPLVNNPAIPFPDQGLAATLIVAPDGSPFYGLIAGSDANANAAQTGFNTVGDGDYFGIAEIGFSRDIGDLGGGNYRFMGWYTGTQDSGHGSGFAVSFDQAISKYAIPFLRYGYSDGGVTDVRHFVSGGLGINAPFNRGNDFAAVGVAWGTPFDPTLDQETLVELFYRLQLSTNFSLTPDLQVIPEPADPAANNTVVIGGIRLQATF